MRRQLAAYSPLTARALAGAAGSLLRRGDADRLLANLLARHRAASGVLCASGTQALQLAISAARTLSGDPAAPVALPAWTCYDVAAAAVGADAAVSLYDVDPRTLTPDMDSLERVLAAGARVVVAAWAYGHPPAWAELLALAARHGAIVVEDAAQGHGAAWRGRPAGSFGALSVLSFGRGKGWTGGRGGALLVHTEGMEMGSEGMEMGMKMEMPSVPPGGALAEMMNLAASAAQWMLGRPSLYALPSAIPGLALGETVYHPPRPPRALPRAAATLLRRTRAAAEREADARRRNARALLAALGDVPGIHPIRPVDGADPGFLRLPLLLDAPLPSDAARLGIARGYPLPLAALPALKPRLTGPERRFPGAETLASHLVTLPTHSLLTPADLGAITALVRGAVPPVSPASPRLSLSRT
ncbi:aminotransferase class I/II-fold pyridoxal phosphate-dependent enzyme [Longimicrobium sp.]|uniref:aminotransferase class I/II-fold pyridoxal phosphate-dependent enzyme n=1 Tax=Longimicrobium sp. TaxID=2029185 RepID=UPI002B6B13DF|nr:aminotransferase class I/II-fold pyridoxal phosphate-dependent enzyme [Longimicrobium sp.]HSU13299.1 aminotransferase class I/II-fold pyridoxal phosphate-dependent enzyme [Longimicrobium sp.]